MSGLLKFILGIGSGSLIGAGAAILLMPAVRAQWRNNMRQRIDIWLGAARQAAEEERTQLKEQLKELQSKPQTAEE